mgnify:CR=1 FL=1|tara:strand:+ start:430 stop:957 length:528 start_codon:yes stop_codon:yes gene_type:complete
MSIDNEYVMTCNNCYREWDGNAQCPCSLLDNSSEDDDDLFDFGTDTSISPVSPSSTRCISPTPSSLSSDISYFINQNHLLFLQKKMWNTKNLFFQKWKHNINFHKLNFKRYDILYDDWFTKKEMNEFYGNNYIWNQLSPEILFMKKDLYDLVQSTKDLPIDRVKLLIDSLFQHIY